jgi:hypothetical protein
MAPYARLAEGSRSVWTSESASDWAESRARCGKPLPARQNDSPVSPSRVGTREPCGDPAPRLSSRCVLRSSVDDKRFDVVEAPDGELVSSQRRDP